MSQEGSEGMRVSLSAVPAELEVYARDGLIQSRRGPWGSLAFLNVLLGWGLTSSVALLLLGRAQDLARQARTDPLTGLANRLVLERALEREWARANREERPLALVALDLDGFKLLNDNRGHVVGDNCLVDVAKELRGVCRRPADFAARLGGDEFVLFLPETDERGAILVAERARLAIRALELSSGPGAALVTASLGVAAAIPHRQEEEASHLLHKADVALYSAKRGGRDRVALASEEDAELIPLPNRRVPSSGPVTGSRQSRSAS